MECWLIRSAESFRLLIGTICPIHHLCRGGGGGVEVVEWGNASPRNNRPRVHLYTRVESSASDDAGKDQVTGENSAARRNN